MPPNGLGISGGAPIDQEGALADTRFQKTNDLAGAKRRPLHARVRRQPFGLCMHELQTNSPINTEGTACPTSAPTLDLFDSHACPLRRPCCDFFKYPLSEMTAGTITPPLPAYSTLLSHIEQSS